VVGHFRPCRRCETTMQHSDLIGAKHAIIIPVEIRLIKCGEAAKLVVSI
jgi:methylphosphotriester-DNA--protein-cysteine methyltransferase